MRKKQKKQEQERQLNQNNQMPDLFKKTTIKELIAPSGIDASNVDQIRNHF